MKEDVVGPSRSAINEVPSPWLRSVAQRIAREEVLATLELVLSVLRCFKRLVRFDQSSHKVLPSRKLCHMATDGPFIESDIDYEILQLQKSLNHPGVMNVLQKILRVVMTTFAPLLAAKSL